MIGLMARAALRGPTGDPYAALPTAGPVGAGYSAPGPSHRSLHTAAECTQQKHDPASCIRVLVVDLDHPGAVQTALDHLATLARPATHTT